MTIVAISDRQDVLGRWREAFPGGLVVPDIDAVGASLGSEAQLWLHVHDLPAELVGKRVAELIRRHPGNPVVVMAADPGQQAALHALDKGARGYCHALATPELLRQVSVVVANGGLWVGPELMKRVLGSVSSALDAVKPVVPMDLSCLTRRELAVAREVGRGATNKEVAQVLGITERTVKAHLAAVFSKLAVRDRLELVIALRDGVHASSRSVA